MLFENPGQPVGVVGEVLEPHRAVFEERHRFAVALHRHHDVEALRADLQHRRLKRRVDRLDHAAGKTEIAHQFAERLQPPQILVPIVAGEFGQQQRRGLALYEAIDDGAEHRDLARQIDHRPVDEFDRTRAQFDDLPRRIHRRVKAREMADAQHPVRRDRLQFEFDLVEEGEGALGADESRAMLCPASSIKSML